MGSIPYRSTITSKKMGAQSFVNLFSENLVFLLQPYEIPHWTKVQYLFPFNCFNIHHMGFLISPFEGTAWPAKDQIIKQRYSRR